ncbi:MFS transporter [Sphingobium sp.]|uniref:MFS transporter n=1 Tax=Sphingobium sp. TaxID=1912891 RepID=UPI000DB2924A|nr:MFS transporter [Sphingobium sp.]PZU64137.1 MAG: MFS transporter [Sphingobium sp.]
MHSTPPSKARRDSYHILASICASGVLIPIVFSGPAIALPDIARDIGGSVFTLSWVVNAYNVALGSFVMAGGALADQIGRKKCFLAGLAIFAITSILIAFAPSLAMLNTLRAIEGLGGALTLTAGASLIAQEFDGHARTRAFSLLGTSFGLGLAFGPLLTGLIINNYGWRGLFIAIAVASAVILLAISRRLKESRDPNATGIDWPGTISFTLALIAIVFAIVQGPEFGWSSVYILLPFAFGVLLLFLFVVVELRSTSPMLDLHLFRYPRFLGVQLLPIATGFSFIALLVYLPIWFIGAKGFSESQAGLAILPLTAPMLIVPFLSGTLAKYISPAVLCSGGLTLAAIGAFLLSGISPESSTLSIAVAMAIIGIGNGIPWGLMDGLAMSVVPNERAGMAAGIFGTMRVVGEAVAIAIMGATLIGLTTAFLGNLPPTTTALTSSDLANAIASGNVNRALGDMPSDEHAQLFQLAAESYAGALQIVFLAIAILAFASAVILLITLRTPSKTETRSAAAYPPSNDGH